MEMNISLNLVYLQEYRTFIYNPCPVQIKWINFKQGNMMLNFFCFSCSINSFLLSQIALAYFWTRRIRTTALTCHLFPSYALVAQKQPNRHSDITARSYSGWPEEGKSFKLKVKLALIVLQTIIWVPGGLLIKLWHLNPTQSVDYLKVGHRTWAW